MPEREIKPGISLAGAIDLEGLKHQVKAEPGQAGGAPAAGGYVIDVTQNNFQAVAQASATYPIVIFMWVPTDNRLFDMARELGDAVNGMDGKLQLARIDVSREPEIAQAFGVQGAPALFALIGGRPMPILQGMPQGDEMTQITTQVLPQLVQVAAQAGVTGTAPYITPQNADDEEDTQKEPAVRALPMPTSRCSNVSRTTNSPSAGVRRRCCLPVPRMRMCARHARRPRQIRTTSTRSWPSPTSI